MATFLLVHGAGDSSFYWHLLTPELEEAGHTCVAPDLPEGETTLEEYADALAALVDKALRPLVVVGQSFGAFAATLVADRLAADLLVLVAGMAPRAGESPDDWWAATGYADSGAPTDLSEREVFYHDVPDAVVAEAEAHAGSGELTGLDQPFPAWRDLPTRFVLGTEDRFFPAPWLRAVVRDRLGIDPDELPGGHCLALSRPTELATLLTSYVLD